MSERSEGEDEVEVGGMGGMGGKLDQLLMHVRHFAGFKMSAE